MVREGAPIRVFTIDDYDPIRQHVAKLVSEQPDMVWVGEAASVADAQVKLLATDADGIVVDARLPDGSGIGLTEWIHQRWPERAVLILTGSIDEEVVYQGVIKGANGFLFKQARGREILAAIRQLATGHVVFDPQLAPRLLTRLRTLAASEEAYRGRDSYRQRISQIYHGLADLATLSAIDDMFQKLVELARGVTDARYAAFAVLNPDESIAQFITAGLDREAARHLGSLPRGRGLLGEVIRTRRPLRVDDIRSHHASAGWPAGHPSMTSFLGVPLIFQNQVVGHLYVTDKYDPPFTEEDEELLGFLASLAAVLIHNARLSRDVEHLAIVEERQRIGMNLHDGTLQAIYAVLLGLDTVLEELPEGMEPIADTINQLAERLQETTEDIRRYILDLKSDQLPFPQAVDRLLRQLHLDTIAHVHTADTSYSELPGETLEHILRILQESLSNIARHAQATRVDITWRRIGQDFQLVIEDDGIGFDPEIPSPPGHHGRQHLLERAERIRGQLLIHSRPHEGTRIELIAPFSRTLSRS